MFRSGQEIVCVDDKDNGNGPTGLVEGEIYTFVRYDAPDYKSGVIIVEVSPAPCSAFMASRFRPAFCQD